MLDLKAGFHNVPMEKTSLYLSRFTTHQGLYHWVHMPMRLMQAPTHFQWVVEAALHPEGAWKFPMVVCLNDIKVFAND